jgi:hypothetical protein
MLDSIKRWLGTSPPEIHAWSELASWARSKQWALRAVREPLGFVIDGRTGAATWRLEWGPSQRPYIEGAELRMRVEVQAPRDLQLLVLNRELMESMEKSVFDQYVEGVQTRIDTDTPSEMRWLVMFPRLSNVELKTLRERFGALASYKPWLLQWLNGPLSPALVKAQLKGSGPLALMIGRRRMSLRTALPEPDVASLAAWLALFECALRETQRMAAEYVEPAAPSTQPSLFSASTMPVERVGS